MEKVKLPEEEWRRRLTPEQYNVLRGRGTEPPFSGALLHNEKSGVYTCAACGAELFSSAAKYDSGTGWPSFFEAKGVELRSDKSHGMSRNEAICAACGSHLGHVFDDGPAPAKKRFCINSLALGFREKQAEG